MGRQTESHAVYPALVILTVALVAAVILAYLGFPPPVQAVVGACGALGAWLLQWKGKGKTIQATQTAPSAAPVDEVGAADAATGENFCPPDPDKDKNLVVSGELSAAHEIQMRLVPHTFPPLPGCPSFDLYAHIEPVREIGGDFYDFWMLGRERLAVVIADVSGKGVPAALFMAMTRTYLRAFSRHIHEPDILLDRLNREVARNNPGCMFVTVFCGIIDLSTGRMVYSNAGHNPPMRKKPGSAPEMFEIGGQPPVGFLHGFKFEAKSTVLEPGEMLLLYTDGLNEALNAEREEFGEERVMQSFASAADAINQCRAVVMQIRSEMAEHVDGAEQYDDITVMAYRQPEEASNWDTCDESESEAEIGDSALESFSAGGASFVHAGLDGAKEIFFSLTDLKNGKE